jgi:CubicO group peptidase (beta-lactamase class C family)
MKLWEDGKLDLDAPVAAYLPEFGDAEHTDLTIRQLLCMTSGYGYNDNDSVQSAGLSRLYDEISESFTKDGQRTTRQVIAEMAKLPLLYRPGKGWRYGVSADILAAAVEAASGMNYRDFLKQNRWRWWIRIFMCRKPSVAGLPKRMISIPAQRCPMW